MKRISRRSFLGGSVAGAALLVGCGSSKKTAALPADAAPRVVEPPPIAHTSDGYIRGYEPALAPPPGPPKVAATPACDEHETEDNIEGPFYMAGAPARKGSLLEKAAKGTRLVLSGKVVDIACQPLAGAVLDVWQANDAGEYDNRGYTLRGKFACGADGSYRIETIIPGRYLNGPQYRPAHIHVKVVAPGRPVLTTQLYFAGDPFNKVDPFIKASLIMTVADAPGGKASSFDFALA